MTIIFSILLASIAFVLRILAYVLYDRSITPEEQDYIFDMMSMSELVFVISTFLLTYRIKEKGKLKQLVRSIIRIILFAQLFSLGKELSGINTTGEPLEKLLFSFLMLIVGYYSFVRIKKWEKKQSLE